MRSADGAGDAAHLLDGERAGQEDVGRGLLVAVLRRGDGDGDVRRRRLVVVRRLDRRRDAIGGVGRPLEEAVASVVALSSDARDGRLGRADGQFGRPSQRATLPHHLVGHFYTAMKELFTKIFKKRKNTVSVTCRNRGSCSGVSESFWAKL